MFRRTRKTQGIPAFEGRRGGRASLDRYNTNRYDGGTHIPFLPQETTMKVSGLQKVTLLDYPGKVAATVFLGGCNFRCPYCHNASLVKLTPRTPDLPENELFSFLRKRKGLIDGVCVSGGEPLMQDGIEAFIEAIKALGYPVKLDTNGSYPAKLKSLVEHRLVDYVAMDVKNSPGKYSKTAGVRDDFLPFVRESAAYLLGGSVDYEFRTTVVKTLHSAGDFTQIGKWLRGAKRYFLQNYRDSEDVLTQGLPGVDTADLEAYAETLRPYIQDVRIRSD